MAAWGIWTRSGEHLRCPNCGRYMRVPMNPKEKRKVPEPKPPSQITQVGGRLVFDKAVPSVLIPAEVKLRPVMLESERRVVVQAGLATIAAEVPAIALSEAWAMWNGWNVGVVVGAAALATMCVVLPLAIAHYVIAQPGTDPLPVAPAADEAVNDDEPAEPDPVGDMAGWTETMRTDGGAILRFYRPPRIPGKDRYVSVKVVQRMAIGIVNARGWVGERDMAERGVPNGPYRLIRQDWLTRGWITARPDRTTVIEPSGRAMIGKIASTPPL